MNVYIVRKIIDDEYGCRDISGVFSTEQAAYEFIIRNKGTLMFKFWDGSQEPYMICESYIVESEK